MAAPSRLFLVIGSAFLALEANALDFRPGHLVYREDFEAESTYPTTPNLDFVSMGGATGFDFPVNAGGGGPELTGTAARAFLDALGAGFESVDFAAGSLVSSDAGARVEFAGLTITGDGDFGAGVSAISNAANRGIGVSVLLDQVGATATGTFRIAEDVIGGAVVVSSEVALSGAQVNALLAGDAFTIDLFFDRAGGAIASLSIEGFASPLELEIVLDALHLSPLTGFAALASHPGNVLDGPTSQVDIENVEFYSSLARPIHVDVGAAFGTPAASYGAAGPVGTWNTIGLGAAALSDGDGIPSGVTATLTTLADSGAIGGGSGDAQALFGDFGFECAGAPDTWTLHFDGLPDATTYRVFVYAPAHGGVVTGSTTLNGAFFPRLVGDPSFGLVQGLSWQVQDAPTDGVIELIGSEPGSLCAGIAGVQLEPLPAQFGPLVINEVLADPDNDAILGDANCDGVRSSVEDEFVEIVNLSVASQSLDGWTLSDSSLALHTFGPADVLAPGQALVLFGGGVPVFDGTSSNPEPWCAANPGVLFLTSAGLSLTNGGDVVTLQDDLGAVVDQMVYGTEGSLDESLNRSPELTLEAPFALHGGFAGSIGPQSPGLRANGTPLPEPGRSSALLIGAGLLALLRRGRR